MLQADLIFWGGLADGREAGTEGIRESWDSLTLNKEMEFYFLCPSLPAYRLGTINAENVPEKPVWNSCLRAAGNLNRFKI